MSNLVSREITHPPVDDIENIYADRKVSGDGDTYYAVMVVQRETGYSRCVGYVWNFDLEKAGPPPSYCGLTVDWMDWLEAMDG